MEPNNLTPRGRRLLSSPLVSEFQARFAKTRAERENALRLVHQNYESAGLVGSGHGEIVYYRPLGLPDSRMLVSYDANQQLVGTLSLVEDNALGLKLDHTYRKEVAELRSGGRRLSELTCLAIRQTSLRAATSIFFTMTRFLFQYAIWRKLDDLLMAVHPRHLAFYKRFFHVDQFGPQRAYQDVQGHPAVACRVDLHQVTSQVDKELRAYYVETHLDQHRFAAQPMTLVDHLYFCEKANLELYEHEKDRRRAG